MIAITPFAVSDLLEMVLSPTAAREVSWHERRALAAVYAEAGNCFTARAEDAEGAMRVIFCGGYVERHTQHASLWAFYAGDIGLHGWAFLLRRARQLIDAMPHRRVDAAVRDGEAAAARWAERCGLRLETTLGEAAPDGCDLLIYRRIEE